MYKYINEAMALLLKAVCDVAKYLFFMVALMSLFDTEYGLLTKIDNVFLCAIASYCLIYIFMSVACKLNMNKKIKIAISLCIVTLSLGIPLTFIQSHVDMDTVVMCIMFTIISIKAVIYSADGIEIQDELRNFMYLFGALLVIFIVAFMLQQRHSMDYINAMKKYLLIFFVCGLMNVARLNILEEYETQNSISINKNKNVVRVNLISIILIIGSLFIVSRGYVKSFLSYIGSKLLAGSVSLFGKVLTTVTGDGADKLKYTIQNSKANTNHAVDGNERLLVGGTPQESFIKDYIPRKLREMDRTVVTVVIALIAIALVLLILYVVFKKINKKKAVAEYKRIKEEKNFIFNIEDLKESLSNLGKKFKNTFVGDNIHPIRKLYIDAVAKLDGKGYKFKPWYTPNEYNNIIEKDYKNGKNMGLITFYYNKLRYGNKEISKDEINKAIEMKESL